MQGGGARDEVKLSTLQGLKSVVHGDEKEKFGDGRGECMLFKRNYSASQQKDESDALLRYVLGVDGDGLESLLKIDRELNDTSMRCHDGVWVEFEARLQYELELIEQQQQQQQEDTGDDTSSNNSFSGAVISRERGACEVRTSGDGCWTVAGLEGFSSASGNFPKTRGKYMYEAQVQTAGVMQIGWMTPNTIFTSEDGIGDSRDSFAFDGKRVRKWNVSSVHYGERWTAGDVITCGIDLEGKKVEFWRNGIFMGVAFASIPVGSNVEYRPGVSLSYGEAVELNFGSRPLRYPVEGYRTLVDPPSKDKINKCEYLVACLERLVLSQDVGIMETPGAAAAKAAAQATDMLFSLRTDENDDSKNVEDDIQDKGHSNDGDILFQEAASALGSHLEPLLEIDYLIDLVVTRALDRVRDFCQHEVQILQRFMEYLFAQLDDEKCERALHSICEYFVRSIKGSHWIQEEIYDLPNINALYLWHNFLNVERYTILWFSSDHWKDDLENLLFVRLPTHKDVETLMPLTSGPEGEDVLENLEFDSMKDDFKIDAVSDLILYFSELENCQMDILVRLFEEENTQYTDDGHSQNREQDEQQLRTCVESYLELHKNEQVTSAPDEAWVSMVVNVLNSCTSGVPERLVAFFRHLCEKNGRSRRDIPPANMSHKSVLASFLSFTLRGTRPFLMTHQVKGKNFNFPAQVFLQGVRSEISSSSEHLQIDARVSGNISYLVKKSLVELCRSTPLTLEVPSLPSSLCRDDWYVARVERPVAMFLKGDPSWSWWFIVASFVLYHFGAENLLRMNQRYLQTFEAALGSFRALRDRLEAEDENSTTEFLKFSLRECKKTMLESLRQSIWYLTWLMPSWKQETLAGTASAMSRILSSAVKDNSQLITFVPEFYLIAILDMIQNCRRADQRSWPDSGYIYTGYFSPVLDLCLEIFMDIRLKSPEVQSSILHTIWMMMKEEDTCEFISKSDSAHRLLFPCLIEAFTSSRNWIHASNSFGLLVQSSGMFPRIARLASGEEENLLDRSQNIIQGWLGEFLESNLELSCKLLDSLIERINWISTEIISLVEDLSKALIDNSIELDNSALLYRRTQAAFDLFYHLCRLLEFVSDSSPKSILDSTASAELLCTRIAEFLAWGLKSFGKNSHLSHEMNLIYEHSAEKLGHHGSSIQLATSIEILAPMLGVLTSLQRKSSEEENTSQTIHMSTSQEVEIPKACGMSDQWHKMLHNLHDLGLTSAELRQALLSISEEDISGPMEPGQQEFDCIQNIVKAFEYMEADSLKSAAIAQDLQPAPSIPDEFLDPILNIVMTEPVILPDSKVTLDRKTIQRHLRNSQTDPFSRKNLTEDELIPNEELKSKLREWLASSQQQRED